MDRNPLISVVVPVYNTEKYLNKCIDSILNQSYSNLELILVNDGSTDKCGEICDSYKLKDARVRVIHKTNSGVSPSRNIGISNAKGKYISFIDSDDTIENDCFQKSISAAKEKDYDLIIFGYREIFNSAYKGSKIHYKHAYDFSGSIKDLLSLIPTYVNKGLIIGPCNKLFRLELLKKNQLYFPVKMSFGEDTIFVYSFLMHAISVLSISDCLYNYNKLEMNTLSSRFRDDKLEIYIRCYEILEGMLKSYNVDLEADNVLFFEKCKCAAFVSSARELYLLRPMLNKECRFQYIRAMISNKAIRNAFEVCRGSGRQTRLLSSLINKDNIIAIDYYFRIKELVRNNAYWLYRKLYMIR